VRAYDNYEVTSFLLSKGARVDFEDWPYDHPLLLAAKSGYATVVEALLDAGHQTSELQPHAKRALYWACYDGRVEVVKVLLKYNLDPLGLTPASSSNTSLEAAMLSEKFQVVEIILRHVLGNEEESHLHAAVKQVHDSPVLVSTLLKYGSLGKGNVVLNRPNDLGRTALFHAAAAGYKHSVKLLLEHGADTSIQDCDYRRVRDVVSTPEVRELIWKHEREVELKELCNDPTGAQGEPKSGVTEPELPQVQMPGDQTLDPSTCKYTSHDGMNGLNRWEISWCSRCYKDIAGFLYRKFLLTSHRPLRS